MLTASHTHSGPAINEREWPLYPDFDREYAAAVVSRVVSAGARAAADMQQAEASFGIGRADIGINRRLPTLAGAITAPNPHGPTDPAVDVLRAGDAVVFNYACHPSAYAGNLIGGDYAGCNWRGAENAERKVNKTGGSRTAPTIPPRPQRSPR